MFDVLRGRDIRSVPRQELEQISEQLMKLTRAINSEVGMRNEDDGFVHGWREGSQYVTFDTDVEAYAAAEKEFGEGGAYRVQRVYL